MSGFEEDFYVAIKLGQAFGDDDRLWDQFEVFLEEFAEQANRYPGNEIKLAYALGLADGDRLGQERAIDGLAEELVSALGR